MIIDKMDWHYSAENFPKHLNQECAGTHIALYILWIIENNLFSNELLDDAEREIEMVKNREMTGLDFLIYICDEKFLEEDLSKQGLEFTLYYYDSEPYYYFNDLEKVFPNQVKNSLYELENSWENYDKIKNIINTRFEEWKN